MKDLIEGRIVHYTPDKARHLAALVIRVWDNSECNLAVFNDSELGGLDISHHAFVSYSEDKKPGTWHWIERE